MEQLIGSMIGQAGLSPESSARLQAAVGDICARMSPLDMLSAMGTLMLAKSLLDAGEQQAALDAMLPTIERYGLHDLMTELAGDVAAVPGD